MVRKGTGDRETEEQHQNRGILLKTKPVRLQLDSRNLKMQNFVRFIPDNPNYTHKLLA